MTVRKGIGVRLAVAYSAVLILSLLALFALAFVLMSSYLRHADHETIQHRLDELAARYDTDGLEGLKRVIGNNKKSFLVRVADADGETLLLVIPEMWGSSTSRDWESSERAARSNGSTSRPGVTKTCSRLPGSAFATGAAFWWAEVVGIAESYSSGFS
jgi:hypothetical protein